MSRIESLALSLFPAPAAPVAVERGTDSGFAALLRENGTAVTRRAPAAQASSESNSSRPQEPEEQTPPAAASAAQGSAKPAAEDASAAATEAESANAPTPASAPSSTAAEESAGDQSSVPVPDMPPAALLAVPVRPLPQQPVLPDLALERQPDGSALPALPADPHLLSALPDVQAPLPPITPAPAATLPTGEAGLQSAPPGTPAAISPELLATSEGQPQTQSRDSTSLPAVPPAAVIQATPTPRPAAQQARPADATSPAGNIPAQGVATTAIPTGDTDSDTPLQIAALSEGDDPAPAAAEDNDQTTANAQSAPEGSAALPAQQPLPAPEAAAMPQQALAGGLNPAAVPLTTPETPTQESESAPTLPEAPPAARGRGKPAAADTAKPQATGTPPDAATGAAKPATPPLSAAPAAGATTAQPGFDQLLQQMQPPSQQHNTPPAGLTSGRPEGTPAGFHGLPLATPVTEQISLQVRKALDEGNNRIRIKMQPAALGQVEVRMEVGHDGSLKAVIAADRHETFEWLQRDARSLERALQENGFKTDTGSLSFQYRGGEGGGQQRSFAEQQQRLWDADTADRRRLDATISITTEAPARQSIASGRLDLNV